MIDTKAIREQILRLAFSAKLSAHNNDDDDVSVLLANVNHKKSIVQTEDVPYSIPEYWRWVKLSDLYEINPKVEADNQTDAAFIPMENISAGFDRDFSFTVMSWEKAAKNHTKFTDNDVAFAKISPCFENRKSFIAENLPNSIGGGTTELIILRQKEMYPLYTYYLVNDSRFIKAGSGSYKGVVGQQRVKSDVIKNYLIPVPPLAEQKRIVQRVEEIFKLLDTIDQAQEKYSADSQILKAKLITAGIQGKLTKQLPSDGTAEELYQQIQAEKQKLIKEGKLKKEKPLPPVSPEEVPFEIPENWMWVRLSSIIDVRDGTHDSPKYHSEGIPLITSKNLSSGKLDFENVKLISYEDAKKINERSYVENGDILFAMIGTIGNPVIVDTDKEFCIKNVALFKRYKGSEFNMNYLYYFLLMEQYEMQKITLGGLQPFVSLKLFRSHLVPLPPLAEQKRIADVLERALGALDKE